MLINFKQANKIYDLGLNINAETSQYYVRAWGESFKELHEKLFDFSEGTKRKQNSIGQPHILLAFKLSDVQDFIREELNISIEVISSTFDGKRYFNYKIDDSLYLGDNYFDYYTALQKGVEFFLDNEMIKNV